MFESVFDRLSALADREVHVAAGATLFRVDDVVVNLHLVVRGTVLLVRTQLNGLELTLQRAHRGSILAEASIFSRRYHCDARAPADAVVRVVPCVRILEAFDAQPELFGAWARHLAHEVQKARGRAEVLSLKTVGDRLDAWQVLTGEDLPAKGNWRRLAAEIGVSPEALYRELARRRSDVS